jgi:iron transport multicopper oxidase
MLSASNPHAAPPLPAGGLLNDSGANATLYFEPGKSYKIRFISMAAISATFFQFDSHKMKVIEIDGVYVQAYEADQIRVAPAQRYSVIVTAKPTSAKNYAIAASMDTNRDYSLPGAVFLTNMTANIIYDSAKPLPGPYIVPSWVPLDDTALTPFDNAGLYQPVTKIITLDFNFGLDNLGIPR